MSLRSARGFPRRNNGTDTNASNRRTVCAVSRVDFVSPHGAGKERDQVGKEVKKDSAGEGGRWALVFRGFDRESNCVCA